MKLIMGALAVLTMSSNIQARVIEDVDQIAAKHDQEWINYKKEVQADQFKTNYELQLELDAVKRSVSSISNDLTDKNKYLEAELQKTKIKLIEASVTNNKAEEYFSKKLLKEIEHLKQDNVLKSKIIAEYQRELEKLKSDKEYKELAKQNFELASQLRNNNLKTQEPTNNRLPASVNP